MYCQNCGAVLKDGVKFCTECGKPVKAPAPAAPAQRQPENPPRHPVYSPAPVQRQPEYPPRQPVYAPAPAQRQPENPPRQPVYSPTPVQRQPVPVKAVEKKRSVPLAALLFAALAIGPFLQNAISASRYLWMLDGSDFRYTFYNLTTYIPALLLFLSALFLIISAVKEFPNGKRPVLGGIALLLASFAFSFFMLNYFSFGIRLRWLNVITMLCFAVCAILFLIAAILAFINKRFAVLGLIGAIIYIILQLVIMLYNLFMRSRNPGYPIIEIVLSEILPYLLRIFFGLALMIFSLKFRPQK